MVVIVVLQDKCEKSFGFLYDMSHVLYHWAPTLRAQ